MVGILEEDLSLIKMLNRQNLRRRDLPNDGRGLVLAYDPTDEKVSAVDKQLLLYRRFATVKWPWEDLINEIPDQDDRYQA